MATVQHRTPVVVRHPLTDQYISAARGQEFDDNDPMVATYPWLFEDDDSSTDRVESVSIEAATAEPGKRRYTRRAPTE